MLPQPLPRRAQPAQHPPPTKMLLRSAAPAPSSAACCSSCRSATSRASYCWASAWRCCSASARCAARWRCAARRASASASSLAASTSSCCAGLRPAGVSALLLLPVPLLLRGSALLHASWKAGGVVHACCGGPSGDAPAASAGDGVPARLPPRPPCSGSGADVPSTEPASLSSSLSLLLHASLPSPSGRDAPAPAPAARRAGERVSLTLAVLAGLNPFSCDAGEDGEPQGSRTRRAANVLRPWVASDVARWAHMGSTGLSDSEAASGLP